MNGNLERDLRGALQTVAAPEGLWEGVAQALSLPRPDSSGRQVDVQGKAHESISEASRGVGTRQAGVPAPRRGGTGFRWAIAAGVLCAIGASLLAFAGKPPAHDEFAAIAFQQVCGHPERLELKTSDLAAVRQWAGAHNMVLQTAGAPAGHIEIAGAATLTDRAGIAVAYRAGGAWSALLIEPSSETPSKRVQRTTRNGLAIFEWGGPRQRYTLVTPSGGRAESACGICHYEVPGRTV